MSTFLIIAVVVIFVLLAAMALFASMRRRDTEAATGALSRETRKRDQSETPVLVGAPASAREVEKSAALERRPPADRAGRRAPSWPPTCRPIPTSSASPAASS